MINFIYYWGFNNDSTFACRYNIIIKEQTNTETVSVLGQ